MKKIIGYSLIGIVLLYQGINIYEEFGYWVFLILPFSVILGIALGILIVWLISD